MQEMAIEIQQFLIELEAFFGCGQIRGDLKMIGNSIIQIES
jgi:hypothetical protein